MLQNVQGLIADVWTALSCFVDGGADGCRALPTAAERWQASLLLPFWVRVAILGFAGLLLFRGQGMRDRGMGLSAVLMALPLGTALAVGASTVPSPDPMILTGAALLTGAAVLILYGVHPKLALVPTGAVFVMLCAEVLRLSGAGVGASVSLIAVVLGAALAPSTFGIRPAVSTSAVAALVVVWCFPSALTPVWAVLVWGAGMIVQQSRRASA